MAIKPKQEILESLKALLGDNASDEALAFTEDLSDTLNGNDNDNWKKKYEENDANWRKRYRDRFFGAPAQEPDEPDEPDTQPKKLTYESLFKED